MQDTPCDTVLFREENRYCVVFTAYGRNCTQYKCIIIYNNNIIVNGCDVEIYLCRCMSRRRNIIIYSVSCRNACLLLPTDGNIDATRDGLVPERVYYYFYFVQFITRCLYYSVFQMVRPCR